jgi:hypothetical protein
MRFFIHFRTLFVFFHFLGFVITASAQADIAKPKSSFIRIVDATDLPDFSQALPMNCCTRIGCLSFNVNLDEIDILPHSIFPNGLYPITIAEHLKHLPKSGLQITQYYIHQGQLLENNICPKWQTWTFDQAGLFHINLMFFVDTFFVIRSDETPNCEVIIWIRPQQIPTGRAAFFRCFN